MLDEFPALGRLDFFESALAFMAGYGVRAFLIAQSLNQIEKAYGPNNSILDNCHVRIAFATNDERTAKRISDALGTATEQRAQRNYAGHRLAPWLSHVMVSSQETQRALITPGEVMQLPPDDAVVMISGAPPIRAKKLRYYEDANFTDRTGTPPSRPSRPAPRPDDWALGFRKIDLRLSKDDAACSSGVDEGGRERQLIPAAEVERKIGDEYEKSDRELSEEDFADSAGDNAAKETMERLKRAAALDRVDKDLLPDF